MFVSAGCLSDVTLANQELADTVDLLLAFVFTVVSLLVFRVCLHELFYFVYRNRRYK